MSQYCSGLIAIVLHEQQPWSVIWSFHECFTVFVAIQDTYIGKTQAHTQNNHPPKNNTTIKGKQKKRKDQTDVGTGGWGIGVVSRKTWKHLGQHTKQHTKNQKKQKRSKPTHEHRTFFFAGCLWFVLFDCFWFLIFFGYVPALESVWGLWITTLIYIYMYIIYLHLWKWRIFYKLWPI